MAIVRELEEAAKEYKELKKRIKSGKSPKTIKFKSIAKEVEYDEETN